MEGKQNKKRKSEKLYIFLKKNSNITVKKKVTAFHLISPSMEGPKAHVPVAPAATQQTLQTPSTKKRPFESDSNSTSNYIKIRALVRDLRPQFIQVHTTTPIFPKSSQNLIFFMKY